MTAKPVSTAYLLGRLLAALDSAEAIQSAEDSYESAVRRPSSLLQAIGRATEWGKEDMIAPIIEALPTEPNPFGEAGMSPEEQSDFALGYYHQRRDLRTGRGVAATFAGDTEPQLEARWEIRLESDLKDWTLQNGGSQLVRALLRAERDRRKQS